MNTEHVRELVRHQTRRMAIQHGWPSWLVGAVDLGRDMTLNAVELEINTPGGVASIPRPPLHTVKPSPHPRTPGEEKSRP